MDLPKFSCLIGLNGSGKSTDLQFIDFLSQHVRGDMKGWLAERKWKSTDLKSKLTKKGEPAGRWEDGLQPVEEPLYQGERLTCWTFVLQTTSGEIEAFCERVEGLEVSNHV